MMGGAAIAWANAINNNVEVKPVVVKSYKYTESPEAREKRLTRVMRKYYEKKGSQQGTCRFCGAVVYYNSRAGRMPIACAKIECKRKSKKQGGKFKETYGTV